MNPVCVGAGPYQSMGQKQTGPVLKVFKEKDLGREGLLGRKERRGKWAEQLAFEFYSMFFTQIREVYIFSNIF
jgi:hypothetical protein